MSKLKPKSDNSPQDKRGAGKPMSKQAIYSMVSSRSRELIEKLFELSESNNQPIRLGALRTLINKVLPDLKVTELQGDEDRPLGVVFLPKKDYDKLDSTPRTATPSTPKDGV